MSRTSCDDGGASLNHVFNGPWGSDWFALGGSPFQFVQGVPKKSMSFWESKLCVCWLINPTNWLKLPKVHFFPKHPTGPCSTCPSWSCNVVYCVVSVNENKTNYTYLIRQDWIGLCHCPAGHETLYDGPGRRQVSISSTVKYKSGLEVFWLSISLTLAQLSPDDILNNFHFDTYAESWYIDIRKYCFLTSCWHSTHLFFW